MVRGPQCIQLFKLFKNHLCVPVCMCVCVCVCVCVCACGERDIEGAHDKVHVQMGEIVMNWVKAYICSLQYSSSLFSKYSLLQNSRIFMYFIQNKSYYIIYYNNESRQNVYHCTFGVPPIPRNLLCIAYHFVFFMPFADCSHILKPN